MQDLDPALLRPGRFDKRLYIGAPKTKKDRDEIVALYLKNKKLAEDVSIDTASKLLFGCSGAEIEQVLNEAVLISLQQSRDGIINLNDIDTAVMKLKASGVKVSHTSKEDIRICAIHEAGHAVMNSLLGRKVSKVSITPYNSGVGGMTVRDTDDIEDQKMLTHTELINDIKVLLAGRAAEEIILGDTSAGCSNDIERATLLAYKVIYNYAMDSDFLINPDVLKNESLAIIDSNTAINKVNQLVKKYNSEVINVLTSHKEDIKKLADRLEIEENIFDYKLEQ
jgi:cell division protease FtsH